MSKGEKRSVPVADSAVGAPIVRSRIMCCLKQTVGRRFTPRRGGLTKRRARTTRRHPPQNLLSKVTCSRTDKRPPRPN